jgi:hypothetical protein
MLTKKLSNWMIAAAIISTARPGRRNRAGAAERDLRQWWGHGGAARRVA